MLHEFEVAQVKRLWEDQEKLPYHRERGIKLADFKERCANNNGHIADDDLKFCKYCGHRIDTY